MTTTARRQIHKQGFWDGACFLYAVANAYKALTGNKVTRQKWDTALEHVPDSRTFLGGAGATDRSYDQALRLIGEMLDAFADPARGSRSPRSRARRARRTSVARSRRNPSCCSRSKDRRRFPAPRATSPAVSRPAPNHWSSMSPAPLEFSGRHLAEGEYVERFHPSVRRYSNDSIAADGPVRVAPN